MKKGKIISVRPKLKEFLKNEGYTQLQFAARSGVPQNFLSRFDSKDMTTIINIMRMAETLEMTVDQFLNNILDIEREEVE